MEYLKLFVVNFVDMFIDIAPYLMLGLLFVAIMDAFIKKETILKHMGKDDFSSVLKASVVGVPLPLCSCGVVPTALGLKKNGASNGAVVSFLTSTPQTGVDSILATYSLMGAFMAIVRPITAFVSGIIAGTLVDVFAKDEVVKTDGIGDSCGCGCGGHEEIKEHHCGCGCHEEKHEDEHCGCGCHEEVVEDHCSCGCHEEVVEDHCSCGCHEEKKEDHCGCGCHEEPRGEKKGFSQLLPALKSAYGGFLDELSVRLLVGIVIATLISTFIPADFFVSIGLDGGIFAMIAMVIVGLPMYICSVASIPIAISLVAKGMSLGSAFVFLFVGPVTNIASIMLINKALGKKITAIYLSTSIVVALVVGILIDFAVANFNLQIMLQPGSVSHGSSGFIITVLSVVFAVLMARGIVKYFASKIKAK
ncbi:MAG: SO_0444 family Cu/Zn efflux transporter [Bacillota bacterium]